MINSNRNITRTMAEEKMAKELTKECIKFEQNYTLEGYEVDFWIKEAGLIIEIDGFTHLSREKLSSDQIKDRKLYEKGYIIIRFENQQIYKNLKQCVNDIKTVILRRKTYLNKPVDLVNIEWKNALRPIKQKLKSLETEESNPINIEAYFLGLDQEID